MDSIHIYEGHLPKAGQSESYIPFLLVINGIPAS